jgi:hypothetical protein
MPKLKCKICSTEFYVKPSHLKLGHGKYCSIKCRAEGQKNGKKVICDVCGKDVWRTPKDFGRSKSGKFFCSKSCQTKWRNEFYSGEKHYLWRGGEFVYRNLMLKSGNFPKCKLCGIDDIRILVVHHRDKNRKNQKLENLVWLCMNCHHLVHNHSGEIK